MAYSNPLLDALLRNESGGRNIPNVHQGTSSGQAQGHFQITTGTWKDFGGGKYAPNPLGATYEQQAEIASKIPLKRWDSSTIDAMRRTGMPVNPNLTLGENLGGNFNSDRYGLSASPEGAGRQGGPLGPRPGLTLTSTPGNLVPALPPAINVGDNPVAGIQSAPVASPAVATAPDAAGGGIMDTIKQLTSAGKDNTASPLEKLANAISPQAPESRPDPIIQTGALQSSDNLDISRMANAQQLMSQLIARRKARVPGFGINGMMG